MPTSTKRQLNPRKLLLSKWTAVQPQNREKHFIVSALCEPLSEDNREWLIELEAVHSHRIQQLPWQTLLDTTKWRQGWC